MPIYEYEPTGDPGCPTCREKFEVVQRMADEPLVACPDCGAAVHRVFSTPSVHGATAGDKITSNKNLAEKGFTKYVKSGDGHYEKVAGKGPTVIKR
ncbi:MAG: FmdB family zinc ribbon protein [Planctomycetia bacterium]